ncbi:MAG: hypothetical protein H0T73_14600, partial [Ardenticatenales bacterium]|nr:hypothetical protein [Ardenticatenales bacterium]
LESCFRGGIPQAQIKQKQVGPAFFEEGRACLQGAATFYIPLGIGEHTLKQPTVGGFVFKVEEMK